MISIYDLKPRFQAFLRPFCTKMAKNGITANQVTIAAIALSAVGGGAIALFPHAIFPFILLPAVLFLRMALNAIDGMLAREFDMKSPLGALLNELGDILSDLFLYLPFVYVTDIPPVPVLFIVILALLVEMVGIISIQMGGSRRYDGPFGKSDRAFAFGLLSVLIAFSIPLSSWIGFYLGLLVLLSLITIWNRCSAALKEVQENV
ncbi:MAG: CDP-alcohol phosphatidyltransferase family protein [Sneathiellales bacterium]|nr:CDP-alcohol phosphatidyltransferase family protein [Sneathiellales bacterium]